MTEFNQAVRDLSWLDDHDALAGVAEVIRERRRQIEVLGYTLAQDRERHADGFLVTEADARTTASIVCTARGVYGPADVQGQAAEAGALLAAEIDRLQHEFGGEARD